MNQIELDPWQKEVLETKGNMCLRSGRQVGKSTVIGLKAAQYALDNPKKLIMIISKTERQAGLLFSKVLFNLHQIDKKQIMSGVNRPTKHLVNLKNGTKIYSLPAGDTGFGIMGFTIDLLIADEAAFIPEEVWNSVIPALAITRGEIWLLSTPFCKTGYYYQCFEDPSFTAFHTSSEDCPRKDQDFLDRQKKILTKARYRQMYEGKFVDDVLQFFSDALIKECCILKREQDNMKGEYVLGVDVAGMGEDDSTFEILDFKKEIIKQAESITTSQTRTTETTDKIIELNKKYDFKKILIDDAGMGIGVFDQLLLEDDVKRVLVGMRNAKKSIEHGIDAKQIKISKEDSYHNLKRLMERKEIQLLDDDEIKASLKCIQAEHNPNTGRLVIDGIDSHHTEGLIRAAHYVKCKGLNLYVA